MPTIVIDQIRIGSNRRPIKDEKVAELMESIKANGLLHPITVDQNLNLVAGLHRLTACKLLGLRQVQCTVITCENLDHAKLAEIDENLIRSELDALERAELWLERDRILEDMGLRAKAGDNQHTLRGSETISPPVRTTLELAKEVGYTDRTFQQGKQIARSIVPEVKELIRNTEIAQSPTTLLKIARAGNTERKLAEQAEKAAQEARAKKLKAESETQAKLAAEARSRQQELQLVALKAASAAKEAKSRAKNAQSGVSTSKECKGKSSFDLPYIYPGEEWVLGRHSIYLGCTHDAEFVRFLPSNARFAIAIPSSTWHHDYLIDEADVVAVVLTEGKIHEFCRQHRMPFRFEWMLDDVYVAIFSHRESAKPQVTFEVQGIEGVVAYLIGAYTQPGNFVISPCLGHGEVLIACEKMGRTCFAGDADPELVARAIARWQAWTGKQATKA